MHQGFTFCVCLFFVAEKGAGMYGNSLTVTDYLFEYITKQQITWIAKLACHLNTTEE